MVQSKEKIHNAPSCVIWLMGRGCGPGEGQANNLAQTNWFKLADKSRNCNNAMMGRGLGPGGGQENNLTQIIWLRKLQKNSAIATMGRGRCPGEGQQANPGCHLPPALPTPTLVHDFRSVLNYFLNQAETPVLSQACDLRHYSLFSLMSAKLTLFTLFSFFETLFIIFVKFRHYLYQLDIIYIN